MSNEDLTLRNPQNYKIYQNFVEQGNDEDIKKFYSQRNPPVILGSEAFKNKILKPLEKGKIAASTPDYNRTKTFPTPDNIIKDCATFFKIEESAIYNSRRGTTNEARQIAIYCLRIWSEESLINIAERFNFQTHSNVSNIVSKIKKRLVDDKKFELLIQRLQTNILR